VCVVQPADGRAPRDMRVHHTHLKLFTSRSAHLVATPRHFVGQFQDDVSTAAESVPPLVSAKRERQRREPTEEELQLVGKFFTLPSATKETYYRIENVTWWGPAGTVVALTRQVKKPKKGGYTVGAPKDKPVLVAVAKTWVDESFLLNRTSGV
jgi:hypothetical protein